VDRALCTVCEYSAQEDSCLNLKIKCGFCIAKDRRAQRLRAH
jgi:hypothetical protein